MPSRQLSPPPPFTPEFPEKQPPQTHHHHHHLHHLIVPLVAATASAVTLLLLLLSLLCHRTLSRKRTAPSSEIDSKPPHRLSYSLLRRATASFSSPLGHGGFGTVFSGTLPPPARTPVAVKLMDPTSHQGEREFHNELFFAATLRQNPHLVTAVAFSSDPKRRRFLLVYQLMHNGNLQDALLHRKCPELMQWNKRFSLLLDVAKGLMYLHGCDPPVIHGDIKPSNILLDRDFNAKIGDFGLARLKSETHIEDLGCVGGDGEDEKQKEEFLECDGGVDDCGSVVEETESVITGCCEEGGLGVEQSPEGFVRVPVSEASSPKSEEKDGFESVKKSAKGLKSGSVKQENEVAVVASASGSGSIPVGESKKVKDYVMEWIGKDLNKERPKGECVGGWGKMEEKKNKKNKSRKRQLEWWESMEEEKVDEVVNKKRRPVSEWWKEERSEEELAKKKKKRKNKRKGVKCDEDDLGDNWWMSDDGLYGDKSKIKSRSRNKNRGGGIDWWLDGLSGELWRARRNSYDSVSASGEIPKSGGVSSTPSMRGTVCYVAPEYGFGGEASEKCDVYSFGVLLLVIISGRRPLQVTGSPLSEFQRANLLSWARHCARNGKLIELVDQSIQSLDEEQALLCIKVALLCLLKSPARRPSMKEIVGMLSGELEPPQLPIEYSPSTPSRYPFKSRKKGR